MCPIPKGFRDRAISQYSTKFVDKKEILRNLHGMRPVVYHIIAFFGTNRY
jgi:hypothetical protein